LADLIFEREWQWVGIDFLTDSLRIDDDELETLESIDFENIIEVYSTKKFYRAKRVNTFLYQLREVEEYNKLEQILIKPSRLGYNVTRHF